jgi:hypothetical protein
VHRWGEHDISVGGLVLGTENQPHSSGTLSQPITPEEWKDIESSKKRLFCLIKVEYADVFDKSYTPDFWWEYRPSISSWVVYRDRK